MAFPTLTTPPVSKGNWKIFLDGILSGIVTNVKIPAVTHGEVSAHPGGAPSMVTAPSGNITYDDLTMQYALAENVPDLLYVWFNSIVDPVTGFGVPAVAGYRPMKLTAFNNTNIPQRGWFGLVWPQKREWDEFEGGSDDPMKLTMTFKVQYMIETPV